ncbi:MAG TPA: SOS response-associated peptidase family protein [Rhizomicrobium sp.]|nr:SOS response-associated peptidase family protein [Rhizomicrobium sp.]
MCNLYTVKRSAAEVAAFFGVTAAGAAPNVPDEILPGYPGLVVREDQGARVLESMVWGFPLRLREMRPDAKPKPVNNIADLKKNMWVGLARKPQWRCLIPTTHFAEAEGAKGRMTRTWFTVAGQPMFAWAGLWRVSDEWGKVYSGVMTDCNEAIRPVHDRMPVILHREEWDAWLNGTFEQCLELQQRVFPAELIEMNRTAELWSRTSKAAKEQAALPL